MITDAPDIFPVYVDESYGPDHPAFCVAGYIFEPQKAKEMSGKWSAVLAANALPYFHMSACNGGHDEFAHLDDTECDAVARKMIALTKQYAEFGFAVAMSERDYNEVFPEKLRLETGTAYSFCLRGCLTQARRWADRMKFKGRFAFFFEKGHKHADEAQRIIAEYGSPRLADHFFYHSSTFVAKEDAEPLQAADILAWQFYTNYKRVAAGKKSRLDMIELIRDHDMHMELTREALADMAPRLMNKYFPNHPFASGEGASGAMPK